MFNQINNFFFALKTFRDWTKKFNLKLNFKDKIKLVFLTNILLPKDISKDIKRKFYESIAIQRVWDDLYDEGKYSESVLSEIREAVMNEGFSEIRIAKDLHKAFQSLLNEFKMIQASVELLPLINSFIFETEEILNGYEYEKVISKELNFDKNSEEEYIKHASKTIALIYIMRALGINLIKNENDLKDFNEMTKYEFLASSTIRMANDLASYEKEKEEGKKNIVDIMMITHNLDLKQTKMKIKQKVLDNLETLKNIKDNKFVALLKRITFLTTNRYLKNV